MKKIYFVHDQQESPAARENFLEMVGYEVVLMKSERELTAALRKEEPVLVMLDVLIEGRNGFEVVADLHRQHPGRKYAMILFSRIYRTRQFRELALRSGASDFILQPIQLDEFLRRVNRVITEWKPAEEPPDRDVRVA